MELRSVSDMLPEMKSHGFSEKVLTSTELGGMDCFKYDYEYNRWASPLYYMEITHWMPLPEPPKQ